MAHELTTNRITKQVEMAALNGTEVWHGLGQRLEEGASIDEWVRAAGMEWTANRTRVRYGAGKHERVVDSKHILFRSDTKDFLGVVGKDYKIFQPREAIEFYRDLVGAAGFKLTTAGTLFGGTKFWATASIGKQATIINRSDAVEGYLLVSSSLDGSTATRFDFTTTCVVCNNTLNMAIGGKRPDVRISHRSVVDPKAVKDQLGVVTGEFAKFIAASRTLAKVPMSDPAFAEFVKGLLVEQKLTTKVDAVGETPAFRRMMSLFKGEGKGATLQGRAGTAWGAVNAVTEYIDHWAPRKSAEHRMLDAYWGDGDKLKSAAFDKALLMV